MILKLTQEEKASSFFSICVGEGRGGVAMMTALWLCPHSDSFFSDDLHISDRFGEADNAGPLRVKEKYLTSKALLRMLFFIIMPSAKWPIKVSYPVCWKDSEIRMAWLGINMCMQDEVIAHVSALSTSVQLHVAHFIIKLQTFLHVSSRSPSETPVLSPFADKVLTFVLFSDFELYKFSRN